MEGFDLVLAGIRLLGRDMAAIADEATRHNGCQLPSRVNKLKDLPSLQTWVMLQRRNSLQLRATDSVKSFMKDRDVEMENA